VIAPFCVSAIGGFHEKLKEYGLAIVTKNSVGGLLGPII
jgi:hypothetical protein